MMSVRKARVSDIPAISGVLAASWKTAYRGIVEGDYLSKIEDTHWVSFLEAGLRENAVFSFVLERDGEMIGASILRMAEEEESTAELISFYLLPEEIGKGSGGFFYGEIEKLLREKGCRACALDVLEKNERAIKFYLKHGFEYTEEPFLVKLGERQYPCKRMRKRLV